MKVRTAAMRRSASRHGRGAGMRCRRKGEIPKVDTTAILLFHDFRISMFEGILLAALFANERRKYLPENAAAAGRPKRHTGNRPMDPDSRERCALATLILISSAFNPRPLRLLHSKRVR